MTLLTTVKTLFRSVLSNRGQSQKYSMAAKSFVSVDGNPQSDYVTVFLNRPPVNSLNLELISEITATIKELESKKCRGFILTSKLPSTFCAGLDIKEIYDPETERFKAMWKAFQEMWRTLYMTPMITVAAINGNAPAGGCILGLSCDYRIMVNSDFIIGINGVHLGVVTPRWVQKLMTDTIGQRNTERSLQLGVLYKPEQALSLNLIDDLVNTPSELMPAAYNKMEQWLQVNDATRRIIKLSMRKPLVDDMHTYEKQEIVESIEHFQSEESKEILSKYIAKLKSRKQHN